MSFRRKTTRFGSTPRESSPTEIPARNLPPALNPKALTGGFLTQTRQTQPVQKQTITRTRGRPSSVFRKQPTKQKQPTVRTTVTTTKVTKKPRTVFQRDDLQRTLNPLPTIRQAFAEEQRTLPQAIGERTQAFFGVPPERIAPPREPTEITRPPTKQVQAKPTPKQKRPSRVFVPSKRDDIERVVEPTLISTPPPSVPSPPPTPPSPPSQRFEPEGADFSILGAPETEVDVLARQDPFFLTSVQQQTQFGVAPPRRFSQDPIADEALGFVDRFATGFEAFEREEFEQRLAGAGVDPRSPVGEFIGTGTEFAVGFSEELTAQGASLINLGALGIETLQRQQGVLPAPRKEVTVPRTIVGEFTGGFIEGLIEGEDAVVLARQRAEARQAELSEARGAGQLGGFLIPLAVGGASIVASTVKLPRAFLPQTTTQAVPVFSRTGKEIGLGLAEVTEQAQVARGLTILGRPIVTKTPQGFVRGAPKAGDLAPQIERLGSTPRVAEGFAEGGRFQQRVNREVLQKLVNQGKFAPEDFELFDDFARITPIANRTPINIFRGFGKQPVKNVKSGKETKALIEYFAVDNPKLIVKGSFAQIPQIRKAGLRQAGDIDIDLSQFADNINLSATKANELATKLNAVASKGRTFSTGKGKEVGKVFVKEKGKPKQKVAEFLNELDGEEALAQKTDIVFSTKAIKSPVEVEGVSITKLTQQFRRKAASVFSLQQQGTRGVPDVAEQFRFGAPKGRFEKDAIDLYHIGKTQVETLRALNRADKFKQLIKLKSVKKSQIDDFEDVLEKFKTRVEKTSKVNFNRPPSAEVKEVISFVKSNPLKSITSRAISGTSKSLSVASKGAPSGSFSRILENAFTKASFSQPSTPSRPSIFSPSLAPSFPSDLSPPSFPSAPSAPSPPPSAPSPPPSPSPFAPPSPPSPSPSPPPSPPSTPSPPPSPSPSPSPPSPTPSITGVSPTGSFLGGFGLGEQLGGLRRSAVSRKSRIGKRLFDIADEPFGAVTVGLGFFIEQEGEETIEQALGLPEEPLTRQERRARERLGRGRRQQRGFAEGFDFSDFFS